MAVKKQDPREYWEKRLKTKYDITVKLTSEEATALQKRMTKFITPPILVGGVISAILIAVFAQLNFGSFEAYIILILGMIPGVIIAAPISALLYAPLEKRYISTFREELKKKAENQQRLTEEVQRQAKLQAEKEAQLRAVEEAKRKTEAEKQRQTQEEGRMKKLQQIIKVSNKLAVERIAQVLELPVEETWKRVFDWAEKFQFTIDGDYILFNKDTVNDFIASMDKEFASWGSQGKV